MTLAEYTAETAWSMYQEAERIAGMPMFMPATLRQHELFMTLVAFQNLALFERELDAAVMS